jgi:hypothetical protein
MHTNEFVERKSKERKNEINKFRKMMKMPPLTEKKKICQRCKIEYMSIESNTHSRFCSECAQKLAKKLEYWYA